MKRYTLAEQGAENERSLPKLFGGAPQKQAVISGRRLAFASKTEAKPSSSAVSFTAADLKLEGEYTPDALLSLSLTAGVNRHARLIYCGYVETERGRKLVEKKTSGKEIMLKIVEQTVFCGMIESINIVQSGDLCTLELVCAGFTQGLELTPQSRLFQDKKMTYAKVLGAVYGEAENASIIAVRGDTAIGVPLLQYEESDWVFTLRLAGKLGTVVTPNLAASHAQIALGFPRGERYELAKNEAEHYTLCRNNEGYIRRDAAGGDARYRDYQHYVVRTNRLFQLGDKIAVDGGEYAVVELAFTFQNGELDADYILGTEGEFCAPLCRNEKQAGVALPGTVISTSGQTLRLKLELQETQEKSSAYSFPYAPQTNNGMYSMPPVGARVMLRWNSAQDGDAVVVHCFHSDAEFRDSESRSFTTEFGKQLAMLPGVLSFMGDGGTLALEDSSGIGLSTKKSIKLRASGALTIRAENRVTFRTPERFKAVVPGKETSAIDVRGGQMHISAPSIMVRGNAGKKKVPYTFAPRFGVMEIDEDVLSAAMGMLPVNAPDEVTARVLGAFTAVKNMPTAGKHFIRGSDSAAQGAKSVTEREEERAPELEFQNKLHWCWVTCGLMMAEGKWLSERVSDYEKYIKNRQIQTYDTGEINDFGLVKNTRLFEQAVGVMYDKYGSKKHYCHDKQCFVVAHFKAHLKEQGLIPERDNSNGIAWKVVEYLTNKIMKVNLIQANFRRKGDDKLILYNVSLALRSMGLGPVILEGYAGSLGHSFMYKSSSQRIPKIETDSEKYNIQKNDLEKEMFADWKAMVITIFDPVDGEKTVSFAEAFFDGFSSKALLNNKLKITLRCGIAYSNAAKKQRSEYD